MGGALSKQLKSKDADKITADCVHALMYPEELKAEDILVPVDVSGCKKFSPEPEELVKKLGVKSAVQAIVDAAALFEKTSSKKFTKESLPIQMTVGDWRGEIGEDDDEDEEEDVDYEEDEEEALDDDEENEPPNKKTKKA